jgi:hypothetical protein
MKQSLPNLIKKAEPGKRSKWKADLEEYRIKNQKGCKRILIVRF